MKVFFNFSIRESEKYLSFYKKIADTIVTLGHQHTNIEKNLPDHTRDVYNLNEKQIKNLYSAIMRAIGESDVIVLEVSVHSITQGYILHKAIFEKKPVIALHLPGKLPSFTMGIDTDKLQIIQYTEATLHDQLAEALDFAKEKGDIRFNLFITPDINNYIAAAAQKKDVSKSAFVREVIEQHKAENT